MDVKLPVDRETGEQRPFAFIAFKHPISGTDSSGMPNNISDISKILNMYTNILAILLWTWILIKSLYKHNRFGQKCPAGPYAERLFNGIQLFEKTIRVRYKGSQRFDQNKYHELYEKLLERLVVENPDKYAGNYLAVYSISFLVLNFSLSEY